MAALRKPMDQSVRASSRAAQPGSGMVVPNVAPTPMTEAPAEIEPRQVSKPAAVNPGANTLGTLRSVCVPDTAHHWG